MPRKNSTGKVLKKPEFQRALQRQREGVFGGNLGIPRDGRERAKFRMKPALRNNSTAMVVYDEKVALRNTSRSLGPGRRATLPATVGAIRKRNNVGMKDLVGHHISWVAGWIYVGNGTLGATDYLYTAPAAGSSTPTTVIRGNCPIAASDSQVGASYISDIEKHYARKRVNRQWMELQSVNPSTANACDVSIAPVRGAAGVIDAGIAAGSSVGFAIDKIASMADYISGASWEDLVLDMTKYIAGGYGAKQNEFVIDNPASSTSATSLYNGSVELAVPSAFAVAGLNSTAALRGTCPWMIVVHQDVDYLDFLGSNSADEPIGISHRSDIFKTVALKREFSKMVGAWAQKDDRSKEDDRDRKWVSVDNESGVTPSNSKGAALAAAGVSRLNILSDGHFDEKERLSPKRSSSLTRPTLLKDVGSKR